MRPLPLTLSLLAAALVILALLELVAPWHAVGQSPAAERFDYVVRDDFFAGLAGDTERLERAMKTCEEVLAKDPKHAEALVWHGAALMLKAGMANRRGEPDEARTLSTRGLREMEMAVELRPADPGVLVPRAAVLQGASRGVRDPDRATAFLRTSVGDYEKAMTVQAASFAALSEHSRGELLGALADGWHRLGDEKRARAYLTRMVAEVPNSMYADTAQKWLAQTPLREGPSLTCVGCHKTAHP